MWLTLLGALRFGRLLNGRFRSFFFFPFDDQFAKVFGSKSFADQFFDQGPVHLFVFHGQRIGVGIEFDNDILLAGVGITPQQDGQFGHGYSLGRGAPWCCGLRSVSILWPQTIYLYRQLAVWQCQ